MRIPPEITSIGTPASRASAMPLAACVSPEPGTRARVPMLPESRLIASAMYAADSSCVTSTGAMVCEALSSS